MNAFTATLAINGLTVDYEIFLLGKKYKALLKQKHLAKYLPYQLDFWKENGLWKSYHPLAEEVINEFGSIIEKQLAARHAGNSENPKRRII